MSDKLVNLEDKIIAYLDGTLDETSRAELLHTLSVSPEKRKLLEEHIKLREIISLGHKPAAVPLMTERKLADRIPVLMQELPYLAEKSDRVAPIIGTSSTSYFTLLGRQVSSFFTSRFGQVVSLGTLALLGGLSWYVASSNGDEDLTLRGNRSAQTQTLGSGSSANDALTDARDDAAGVKSVDKSALNASRANSNVVASSTLSRSSNTLQSAARDRSTHTSHSASTASVSDRGMRNSSNAPIADRNDAFVRNSEQTNATDIKNSQSDIEQNASQSSNAANNANNVNSDASSSVSSNAVSKSDVNSSERANEQTKDIKDPKELPPLPLPSQDRDVTGRWIGQLDYSGSFNVRPNVKAQQYETTSGIGSAVLGLGYEFNDRFAIGIEGGRSSLSQQQQERTETPVAAPGPAGSQISVNNRVTYTTDVNDVNALWGQATLRYAIFRSNDVHLEVIGGAGAALVDGSAAPMVSLGGAAVYDLNETFALTAGVTARGAWLSGLNAPEESSSTLGLGEAKAVVSHQPLTDDLFSSSIGFRAGIRVGF
jgi:hypothetical protein